MNKFFSGNYYYYLLLFSFLSSSRWKDQAATTRCTRRGTGNNGGVTLALEEWCGGEGTETVTDKGCGPGSFGKGVG